MTRDEAYERLDQPFNPPQLEGGENAFVSEWEGVCSGLEKVLTGFGEADPYGDKDFYIGETTNFSRGIGVSLTSSRMINPSLISRVQSFLSGLSSSYEVNFTLEIDGCLYQMFISSSDVRSWLPDGVTQKFRGIA